MGVYIKGMEMPKCGAERCIVIRGDGTIRTFVGAPIDYVTATPVPPHGDLVDASYVARKVRRFGFPESEYTRDEIAAWFENGDFPTIIPADKEEET